MGRPRTPILSRERIATVALELIDQHGEESFTMAKIATHLGVTTPSLYNHVDSKEELIELVRALVVEPIDTTAFLSYPWDQAVVTWARSYRSAFAHHPNTIQLLATRPIRTPFVLYMYQDVIDGLLGGGWPIETCLPIITAIENFILGSALDSVAPEVMIDVHTHREEVPLLTKATEINDASRANTAFEMGLTALISGLCQTLHNLDPSRD
ncbi:TetR/AcrR family transcriptional regulator C-terminal domain-containing protein [Ferrimicrobium sp.]|uniref:TetR/AcrR family transcriptional regulator C-terminal domain-containing protein n=1 Tax=Ferrimicrobium sp. TaxID=2926050 RepID=UPI00261E3245|nr:TetR/AcrR family transcriptional regulator C-terminal domain-containing protein [Ferrimicrobium sp.]